MGAYLCLKDVVIKFMAFQLEAQNGQCTYA